MPDWSWPEALWPEGVSCRMLDAGGRRFELAEAGSGARLALCLHGFPELNMSWRAQMPLLAARGWRVWAPNLRGYGMSHRPGAVADYAIERLLEDLATIVDVAAPTELMLVAHDWGGALAWEFARRRVRPLSRFIILNMPHPACFARELRRNPRQMLRSWYIGFFQPPGLAEWALGRNGARAIRRAFATGPGRPPLPDAVLDAYAHAAARPGALTAMVNWYRAAVRHPPPPAPERVDAPTLMIWGDADVALDIATTRGTDRFVAPFTFHRLPGVSHWVQQDAPDAVNALIAAWLDGAGR